MNFRRLVKWDMRTPSGAVQELNSPIVTPVGGKDYARNTNFNCMASSGRYQFPRSESPLLASLA